MPSGIHGHRKVLGFDDGMISTSKGAGTYTGVGTKRLKRDPDYPIRVTIQHYKVSGTTEVLSDVTLEMIGTLNKVYTQGDSQSSLALEDTKRVTEAVLKPVLMYNF